MSLHNLFYLDSNQESYIKGNDNVEVAYLKKLILRIKPPREYLKPTEIWMNKKKVCWLTDLWFNFQCITALPPLNNEDTGYVNCCYEITKTMKKGHLFT